MSGLLVAIAIITGGGLVAMVFYTLRELRRMRRRIDAHEVALNIVTPRDGDGGRRRHLRALPIVVTLGALGAWLRRHQREVRPALLAAATVIGAAAVIVALDPGPPRDAPGLALPPATTDSPTPAAPTTTTAVPPTTPRPSAPRAEDTIGPLTPTPARPARPAAAPSPGGGRAPAGTATTTATTTTLAPDPAPTTSPTGRPDTCVIAWHDPAGVEFRLCA